VPAAHQVKYSRKEHDQRQANRSKRGELRFDAGYRRQDQAYASEKLQTPVKTNRPCGTAWIHATG
jgi:hypothetical protein